MVATGPNFSIFRLRRDGKIAYLDGTGDGYDYVVHGDRNAGLGSWRCLAATILA